MAASECKPLPDLKEQQNECLTFSPDRWEAENFVDVACICGVPSTENMVQCNGETCPIFLYHRECVATGSDDFPAAWYCDICRPKNTSPAVTVPASSASDKNSSGSKQKESESSVSDSRTKKKNQKWKPQLAKETLVQKAKDIISGILQMDNPFYTGTDIAACAHKIDNGTGSFTEFAETIVSGVWDCAESGQGHYVGPQMNTAIFKSFHKFRCGDGIMASWDVFLESQSITTSKRVKMGLLQYLLRCTLEEVMRQLSIKEKGTEEDETCSSMTKEEENVLRYVAGFVPFALLKRYTRMKSQLGKRYRDILLSWKIEMDSDTVADTFLAYTNVWMTYQNRGGLYRVSDKVYMFFRSIELVVRKQLLIHKLVGTGVSAKEILETAIRASPFTEKCWEVLISDKLGRDESEKLFSTIVNYFIKIRMNSFVKVYANIKKRESTNKGLRGRKALRKELKNNMEK